MAGRIRGRKAALTEVVVAKTSLPAEITTPENKSLLTDPDGGVPMVSTPSKKKPGCVSRN